LSALFKVLGVAVITFCSVVLLKKQKE